jgi:hypothetical protein
MSTFDSLFPVPTGGRNADDMGLPPAPKVEASLRAPAEVAQPDQANTVACMDSWARAQGLATYTAMGNALRDLLDMWHGGHIQVRQEASGAWHAAVQSGEAAISPVVSSHKQGDALQEAQPELTDERIGQIWDSVSEEEHDGVSWDAVKAFALAIRDLQVAIPGEARFNAALAYADQVARGCIDDGKRNYIIQAARNAWIKGALAATPPQAQDQEQQG